MSIYNSCPSVKQHELAALRIYFKILSSSFKDDHVYTSIERARAYPRNSISLTIQCDLILKNETEFQNFNTPIFYFNFHKE